MAGEFDDSILQARPPRRSRPSRAPRAWVLCAVLWASFGALAQTPSARWRTELAAFERADREQPPAGGGVLFVGSSTVRLWPHLAQDFPQWPAVVNRGFGGSTLSDCSGLAHELVGRHRPRQVVVYAGDNDLAEGQTPTQVLESFLRFEAALRAELPEADIAFVSIKPSPSRESLLEAVRRTNRLIAAAIYTLPRTRYIDVFTSMLDDAGRPRPELFRADRLHMNEDGYRLWRSVIASQLAPPATAAAGAGPRSSHSVSRAMP
ncbi:MAG: lipolytic protein family [Variovorax sp.]|nr:lipolytic protein family [Variovorax sp.]